MKPGPLGIQPARGVLAARGIEVRQAAAALGMDPNHIGRVLTGHHSATKWVRYRLSEWLDMPADELFCNQPERSRQLVQ